MKNLQQILLTGLLIIGISPSALAVGESLGGFNPAMGAGATSVHDLQMINDMKFRYQEYNDYKDLKEQKNNKNKEFQLTEPAMKKIYNQKPKQNVQFIEENGKIKIQSY